MAKIDYSTPLKIYNDEFVEELYRENPWVKTPITKVIDHEFDIPKEFFMDYIKSISDNNFVTEKPMQSRKKANRHSGSKGHQRDLARHGSRKQSRERYYIDSEYTSRKAFRDAYYGREGRNMWQYDNGHMRNCRKANRKGEPVFIPEAEETVTLQFEIEYVEVDYDFDGFATLSSHTEKDYGFSVEDTIDQIPFWIESYLQRKRKSFLSGDKAYQYDEVYLYPLVNGERTGSCYRVDTAFFCGIC